MDPAGLADPAALAVLSPDPANRRRPSLRQLLLRDRSTGRNAIHSSRMPYEVDDLRGA